MPKLIWSPSSRRDLEDIRTYFFEHGAEGVRVFRAIQRVAGRLQDYPRLGRLLEEPFRAMGVQGTEYLLIYRLRDHAIEIVRVRHGRQDWLAEIEADL